jgi:hypothetical protein
MTGKFVSFFGSLLLLGALAVGAFGQMTGGRVAGTVTDSTGAVVTGAKVTLSSPTTGQTLTTQTSGSGLYVFPNVAVGDYTVTVEGDGFQPVRREVRVALNQESVADAVMQVGAVAGTMEVSAASGALVSTDNSQLGRGYGDRQALSLPIFGNQNALALLAPNVVEQAAGVSGVGGAVGGARPRGNVFNVDGVDNNDPSVTGPSTKVIQDAVQEFTLLSNNFNAEFGAGAGGQFNTITKTGTNQYRGSAFLYLQNEGFNAAPSLASRQFFRDERFGGTFGGPVVKDKLFFFGAYQRERIRQRAISTKYSAPTADGLQQIAALPGASQFVVDLLRNNLTLAPTSNRTQTVLGSAVPFGDVVLGVPAGSTEDLFQVNIDHLPNARDQFRHRFSFGRLRAEQMGGGNANFNNLAAYDTRLFSSTWVRAVSSSLINDARFAYRRVGENYPLKDASAANFPNIVVTQLNLNLGPATSFPQGAPVNNYYQLYDALTWVRGAHSFKFGGEMRRLIWSQHFLQFARGYYDYTDFDQLLRDAAPGNPTSLRGAGSTAFTGNNFQWHGFAQDDWKVRPHLTLNLGVRYEYTTLPRDLAAQQLNALASVPGVIDFRRPRTDRNNFAPRVGFAYSPAWDNAFGQYLFGERGQSAIRAHFGVTHYDLFQNLTLTSMPPQAQQILDLSTAATAFGFDPARPFLQNGGIPNQLVPITSEAQARAATAALIPDRTTPYAMSWTLSFQRELSSSTVLELRYLGTRGRKLPVQLRLNAGLVNESNLVIPTFFAEPAADQLAGLPTLGQVKLMPGTNTRPLSGYGFGTSPVTSYQMAGNSVYDAASVSVTRRFSRDLGFTAAYTFSKTMDDSTAELNSSALNPRRPQDFYNLGGEWARSALDIPHRFAGSLNYDVPYFGGADNRWLKAVFGGYQVNAIFQAQSGQPITVRSGVDSNLNFDNVGDRAILNLNGVRGTSSAVRAVNAAGQTVAMGNNATVAYVAVNPNAEYIQAGVGARAPAGRNTLRTRGFNRTDANFVKGFSFGERGYGLQFGAEISNLFNQRNPTVAGVGPLTAAFATTGNRAFNDYGIGNYPGRLIQLRAKITF